MQRFPHFFVSLTIAALLPASALADSAPALSALMDTIASNYAAIKKQAVDASKNPASANNAATMLTAVYQAVEEIPPKIAGAADERSQELAYQSAMAQLYIETAQLEQAFLTNNAAQVTAELAKIDALQAQGHSIFRN